MNYHFTAELQFSWRRIEENGVTTVAYCVTRCIETSISPLWVLGATSVSPLWVLGARGGKEVQLR